MSTPTIEEQVNEVVGQLVTADDGKVSLPDGVKVDDAILYAAKTEKRRRDTQASYTKGQQEVQRLTKENTLLAEKWEEDAVKSMSSAEQTELEELKSQDPDAWHQKLIDIKKEKQEKFREKRESLKKEVTEEEELAMRESELETFNAENPDFQITDDVIENDIPPRMTKKLAEGKITFVEFLDECKAYLGKGKKIAEPKAPAKEVDLSNLSGSSEPTPDAKKAASANDYKDEVY